uniref:AMP-binding domain-containing protein n=1 Tax=Rhabditophanes sp. KR3021 TaxID=114890 RepID=A0AC35UAT6_9BILA
MSYTLASTTGDDVQERARKPLYLKAIAGFAKLLFIVCDVITFIPFQIFDNPQRKLDESAKMKALQINQTDPNSAYRNADSMDKLQSTCFPDCPTLDSIWTKACVDFESSLCMGTRQIVRIVEDRDTTTGQVNQKIQFGEYKWETYGEVNRKVNNVSNSLDSLALQRNGHVVIFSETRAEWMITAQSCFRKCFPVVTVYATLGEEAVAYAINESDGVVLFTTAAHLSMIQKISDRIPQIGHIIYFEDPYKSTIDNLERQETITFLKSKFKSCTSFESFLATGENTPPSPKPPNDREDIAMIMYTSGTTGKPKGCVLSHKNIIGTLTGYSHIVKLNPTDTYIAYLPQSHILECCAELVGYSQGCKVAYSSPHTLIDTSIKILPGTKGDIGVAQPTVIVAVPAIINRIYKAVNDKVSKSSAISKEIFDICFKRRKARYEKGYSSLLIDRLIFGKIKQSLGGKTKLVICGGAFLNVEPQRFINICFGCPVIQGFGLTETCGGATLTNLHDLTTGIVGPPLTTCEIRLREWAEANYSPTNRIPQGEILIHGDNVCQGFYKNEEQTKEAFVEIEGKRWFCSGDIGEICADGSLKIIDRKKDLIKLSHGEYVSLSKIEGFLLTNIYVDNVCIYASVDHNQLVVLLVPNENNVRELGAKLGVTTQDWKSICENKMVKNSVLKELQKFVEGKLLKHEIPSQIYLCHELWTPASGLLTEAMKLKRKVIETRFKSQINDLFK